MATLIDEVMFRAETTPGLSGEQLDHLNEELSAHLSGLEPGSEEYMTAAREFATGRAFGMRPRALAGHS
jgi:hypothetical protein